MLNIDFQIQSIHYEKTFERLCPYLMEAVKGMNEENLVVRLIQKLGENSRNVFMGILKNLPQKSRNELLWWLAEHYKVIVCKRLNDLISVSELSDSIHIDRLSAQWNENEMVLSLDDVYVNYANLLKNRHVQDVLGAAVEHSRMGRAMENFLGKNAQIGARVSEGIATLSQGRGVRTAISLFQNKVENLAVETLEKKYLPEQLGKIIHDFLLGKGIHVELGEVLIRKSEKTQSPADLDSLSKELEYALIDAIALYLKETEAR